MGPFDPARQQARADACMRIVLDPHTTDETKRMWQRIHNRLALTETEYLDRIYLTYRTHTKELIL